MGVFIDVLRFQSVNKITIGCESSSVAFYIV